METFYFFVAVAVLSVTLVNSLPLRQKYSTRQEQEEYFEKYGYYNDCLEVLPSEDGNEGYGRFEGDALEPGQFADGTEEEDADSRKPVDPDDERFWRVVICFQRKFGLRQTGVVDEATREMMELQENDLSEDLLRRKKRFVKIGVWNKEVVTYYIKNYDVNRKKTSITDQVIRSEIQRAIKMWTDVSNLKVTELNSTSADIVIGFYPDNHGDTPFKSNSLAHTFAPGGSAISGDMHLKADMAFTAFTSDGVNLWYVVLHEFGHAIGLGHSNEPGAVMNPVRRGYDPNQKLGEDDIKGVQSLYGAPAHR